MRIRAERYQSSTQVDDIVRCLHEAQRHIVKILTSAPLYIRNIFGRQNVAAKISVWQIESLAAHQKAIILHLDFYRRATHDLRYHRADLAVEHKQRFTNLHLLGQIELNWQIQAAIVFGDFRIKR